MGACALSPGSLISGNFRIRVAHCSHIFIFLSDDTLVLLKWGWYKSKEKQEHSFHCWLQHFYTHLNHMLSEMFLLISLVTSSFEVLMCDLLPSTWIALFSLFALFLCSLEHYFSQYWPFYSLDVIMKNILRNLFFHHTYVMQWTYIVYLGQMVCLNCIEMNR